jgi:hypothetical protein
MIWSSCRGGSFFWDTMPWSLLQVNRHFGGISHLHLQGSRVSQERNQYEAGSKENYPEVFTTWCVIKHRSNITFCTWTHYYNLVNDVQMHRQLPETAYTLSGQINTRMSKPKFSRSCGMPHPYHGSCHDRSTALKWFLQINQQTCYPHKIYNSTNVLPNEYWCWRLISRPKVYRQFANSWTRCSVCYTVPCLINFKVSLSIRTVLVEPKLRFKCLSDNFTFSLPCRKASDSRSFVYERKKNGEQKRRKGKRTNSGSGYGTKVKCPMTKITLQAYSKRWAANGVNGADDETGIIGPG